MNLFTDTISDLFIGIGLAMDCFAVSIAISLTPDGKKLKVRTLLPLFFGVFQGGMAFLGWLAGNLVVDWISSWDHWIAFVLLSGVGLHMILETGEEQSEEKKSGYDRIGVMILLAIATSIDAMAVGLSFASIGEPMVTRSLIIGLVSFLFTILGLVYGKFPGKLLESRAELGGGVILILIGLKILLEHTLFS